jgi:leucyl aminopeptidase
MLELKTIDAKKQRITSLAIPVCQDGDLHTKKAIQALAAAGLALPEFSAEKGQSVVLYDPPGLSCKRAILYGLGKIDKVDAEALRRFAGSCVKQLMEKELPELTLATPAAGPLGLEKAQVYTALMEGALLANHRYDAYRAENKQKPLKKISLDASAGDVKRFSPLTKRTAIVCAAVHQAREWVSMPANDKRPEALAEKMTAAARKAKLKVQVIRETALAQKRFGALLAVGQGSSSPPRLVVLSYTPPKATKTVALVGKGVTFDTGGTNLKPTSGLGDMKTDMAGSAAVAATLLAVARLKPKTRVIGLMPLAENMLSGNAIRPGDIITAYSGKTIEIGNTDAEGRLILADAMAYAIDTFKPDTLIDMATLTGACVVALGEKLAGLFTADEKLRQALLAASRNTHERCWPMPLPEDYKELLKSDLADTSNMSSTRWGGAITAALFLQQFVGETSWAHIDIAGPASSKKGGAYCGPGGTGFGVRLLTDFIVSLDR